MDAELVAYLDQRFAEVRGDIAASAAGVKDELRAEIAASAAALREEIGTSALSLRRDLLTEMTRHIDTDLRLLRLHARVSGRRRRRPGR